MSDMRIEKLIIRFDDQISMSQRQSILQQLYHEYNRLYKYLLKHDIWDESRLNGVQVFVKCPLFGQHAGMRKGKDITLFGVGHYGYLIHELVHVLYPTEQFRFHEGFANYIQSILADNNFTWGDVPLKYVAKIHLLNQYSFKHKNYIEVILDSKNFNDPRLNRCKFTRSLASGFVAELIDQLGIKEYIIRYHQLGLPNDMIQSLSEISLEERVKFDQFLSNMDLRNDNVEAYNHYFIEKEKLFRQWKKYYEFGVEERGHPLKNWDMFPPSYHEEIMKLYKREITMNIHPLKSELWEG